MFTAISINPVYNNLAVTDLWLIPGTDQAKQWAKDKCAEAWGNKVVVSTFKREGDLELAEVYDTNEFGLLGDLVFLAIVHC